MTGRDGAGIALKFVNVGYGSPEHYYHFLWGYLLPGIDLILQRGVTGPVHIMSCGPVMDERVRDAAATFGIDFRITDRLPKTETWDVSRLDVRIASAAVGPLSHPDNPVGGHFKPRWKKFAPDLDDALENPDRISALPGELRALRDRLQPQMMEAAMVTDVPPYVIIKRSPPHPFYDKSGLAKVSGYGTGRRSLQGIEETVTDLVARGYDADSFDCAAHTLSDQARCFEQAKGIAMIRGAEVANLIWVQPGTPVLILEPTRMVAAPPHTILCRAAGAKLTVVPTDQSHLHVDGSKVASVWSGASSKPPPGARLKDWVKRALGR